MHAARLGAVRCVQHVQRRRPYLAGRACALTMHTKCLLCPMQGGAWSWIPMPTPISTPMARRWQSCECARHAIAAAVLPWFLVRGFEISSMKNGIIYLIFWTRSPARRYMAVTAVGGLAGCALACAGRLSKQSSACSLPLRSRAGACTWCLQMPCPFEAADCLWGSAPAQIPTPKTHTPTTHHTYPPTPAPNPLPCSRSSSPSC